MQQIDVVGNLAVLLRDTETQDPAIGNRTEVVSTAKDGKSRYVSLRKKGGHGTLQS